jgi:hypothetical protein
VIWSPHPSARCARRRDSMELTDEQKNGNPLRVTRDGVPLEDQAAAVREFARQSERRNPPAWAARGNDVRARMNSKCDCMGPCYCGLADQLAASATKFSTAREVQPEKGGAPGFGSVPAAGILETAIEEALASLEAGMAQGAADTLREALSRVAVPVPKPDAPDPYDNWMGSNP